MEAAMLTGILLLGAFLIFIYKILEGKKVNLVFSRYLETNRYTKDSFLNEKLVDIQYIKFKEKGKLIDIKNLNIFVLDKENLQIYLTDENIPFNELNTNDQCIVFYLKDECYYLATKTSSNKLIISGINSEVPLISESNLLDNNKNKVMYYGKIVYEFVELSWK